MRAQRPRKHRRRPRRSRRPHFAASTSPSRAGRSSRGGDAGGGGESCRGLSTAAPPPAPRARRPRPRRAPREGRVRRLRRRELARRDRDALALPLLTAAPRAPGRTRIVLELAVAARAVDAAREALAERGAHLAAVRLPRLRAAEGHRARFVLRWRGARDRGRKGARGPARRARRRRPRTAVAGRRPLGDAAG